MKKAKSIGMVCLLSAMAASGEVVTVDGWTVNDESFRNDDNGTFTAFGFSASVGLRGNNDWGQTARYDTANQSGDYAEWKFSGLPAGTYQVTVSHEVDGNRSTAAPYTVQGIAARTVNQREAASGGPTLSDGSRDIPFKLITSIAVVSDGTLTVRLDDVENTDTAFVIADAVAIRAVTEEELKRIQSIEERRADDRYVFWKDPSVYTVNTLSHHCTHVPYPDSESAKTCQFEQSSFHQSMNGNWKFSWAKHPSEHFRGFEVPDFDDSAWKEIPVPSCWEIHGYGKPYFGTLPTTEMRAGDGHVIDISDEGNSIGSYRTTFTLPGEWDGRQVILHFNGVSSAFNVWINGKFAGYDQDAWTDAEFNITKHLKEGENVLAVEVIRWSDGSNLEDAAAVLPVFQTLENHFYTIHNERTDDTNPAYTVLLSTNLVSNVWKTNGVQLVGEAAFSNTWKAVTNRTDMAGDAKFIRLTVERWLRLGYKLLSAGNAGTIGHHANA